MKPKSPERYSTLLRVRKRQEELKSQALAGSRRVARDLQQDKSNILKYREEVLDRAGKHAAAAVDAVQLRGFYEFERHLVRLGDAKDAKIAEHQIEVDARRVELEDGIKQRRIVERLIERLEEQEASWRVRREQRDHDELSTIHFAGALLKRRRTQEANRHEEDIGNAGAGHHRLPRGHHRSNGSGW